MHHLTDRMTHDTAFVTPVVEHWLERCDIDLRQRATGVSVADIAVNKKCVQCVKPFFLIQEANRPSLRTV